MDNVLNFSEYQCTFLWYIVLIILVRKQVKLRLLSQSTVKIQCLKEARSLFLSHEKSVELSSPGLARWLCNPSHMASVSGVKAGGHFQPKEDGRRTMRASSFHGKDDAQNIQLASLLPPCWPGLDLKANMAAWESERICLQLVGHVPSSNVEELFSKWNN